MTLSKTVGEVVLFSVMFRRREGEVDMVAHFHQEADAREYVKQRNRGMGFKVPYFMHSETRRAKLVLPSFLPEAS